MAGPTHKCAPYLFSSASPSTCALSCPQPKVGGSARRVERVGGLGESGRGVGGACAERGKRDAHVLCVRRPRAFRPRGPETERLIQTSVPEVLGFRDLECQKVSRPAGESNLHNSSAVSSSRGRFMSQPCVARAILPPSAVTNQTLLQLLHQQDTTAMHQQDTTAPSSAPTRQGRRDSALQGAHTQTPDLSDNRHGSQRQPPLSATTASHNAQGTRQRTRWRQLCLALWPTAWVGRLVLECFRAVL